MGDMAKSAWGKAKQVGGKVAAGTKKAYGAAKQGYKVAKPIVHGVADVAGKYGGAVCGAAGKYSKACKTGVKGIKKVDAFMQAHLQQQMLMQMQAQQMGGLY